jgi:hypothetical protein
MVRAGHGRGMTSVNQTGPHCVNQMGKTHSKPLAARRGRRTTWAWHAVCESTLNVFEKGTTLSGESSSDHAAPTAGIVRISACGWRGCGDE